MWKDILSKVGSGRYILTVITGLVFGIASLKGLIDKDVIATIIVMVFTLYFSRNDRGNGTPKST